MAEKLIIYFKRNLTVKYWAYISIILLSIGGFFLISSIERKLPVEALEIDFYKPMSQAYKYANDSLPLGNILCKTTLKNEVYYFETKNLYGLDFYPIYLPVNLYLNHNKFGIQHSHFELDYLYRDNIFFEKPEELANETLYVIEELLKNQKYLELKIHWLNTSKEKKEEVLIPILLYIKEKQNNFSFKKYKKPFEMLTPEQRASKDFMIDVMVFNYPVTTPPPIIN